MSAPTDSLFFADALGELTQHLDQARNSVVCAAVGAYGRAWFDALLSCKRRGVEVTLVLEPPAPGAQGGLAWERLSALGARVHWLERHTLQTPVCVVDATVVISGDFPSLGLVLEPQFKGLLVQADAGLAQACEDGILQLLPSESAPDDGADHTQAFPETDLAPYNGPDRRGRSALQWQLLLLQAHALALDADMAEMHRQIKAFDREQDASIGALLREFLDAKRRYFQQLHAQAASDGTQTQAQQAQDDFDRYTASQDAIASAPVLPRLAPEEQRDMKLLYRKLAMRCHPDRVDEGVKSSAQALFQRLQNSYETNDLASMRRLQTEILEGPWLDGAVDPAAPAPTGRDTGAQALAALQDRLARQHQAREQIVRSPTWRTLSSQSNWSLWFEQQARFLQADLQRYTDALHKPSPETSA